MPSVGRAFVFIPDPTIAAQIKVDPEVGAAVGRVGAEALSFSKDHAPVETGALRSSMRVERIEGNGARVSVNVDYWLFPEFGTVNMTARPYLRPALSALGLNLT
jgi:HK97 gp10 family phage protein